MDEPAEQAPAAAADSAPDEAGRNTAPVLAGEPNGLKTVVEDPEVTARAIEARRRRAQFRVVA
jgi:hypothetical protein